jgi:hypothetical protein
MESWFWLLTELNVPVTAMHVFIATGGGLNHRFKLDNTHLRHDTTSEE